MSQVEDQVGNVVFEFVERDPIEATFQINMVSGDLNYVHYQDEPSTHWVINHNLGKFPSVTVVTSAGDLVQTDYTYIDQNTIEIYFTSAFGGRAYIN